MFLDWIAQLRLLQHDPQTNILGALPLSIRRLLISEITSYFHPSSGKPPPDPSIFTSPAHVKWFMEVLGQGFNLPLEDMAITNDDIDIYARWLFEQNTRPAAVVKDGLEQEFFQIIFHQFSLLFQPRIARSSSNSSSSVNNATSKTTPFHMNMLPVAAHANMVPVPFTTTNPTANSNNTNNNTNANTLNSQTTALKETLSQLVQRHIELCKKTLKVFAMAGRTLKLSEESWAVLLKVVLGITDYLLKEPTGENTTLGVMSMSDELCDSLLQVLFELWLRSTTMDVEMWDILKTCFARWTHRPKAIQQWSITSFALTKRVQNLIYGGNESSEGVHVNGTNIKLDLPSDFVYYAWHRVIYLIPHPLQLPSGNFTLALLGIGNLIDTLNTYSIPHDSENPESAHPYPDGNTLLNMFGTYLFDATSKATDADQESQRGCAESFATLCKIFCKPQKREPFLRTYIERFYAALTVGLKSDACLPTILLSCTELFATDLEGVRMLVPDFISAIKMVLPKLRFECRTNVSIDNLRLAAIKVTSTIMCMPNHFDKVELKLSNDFDMNNSSVENVSLIGEQEQLITQLIRVLYALPTEDDPETPFLSLKFYILEILLMSLRTETSSYNMRYILHLINVYVREDVPFCPGLVGTVVKLIQDKILTMQLPADVTLVAFDVLMDFVDLYDFIKRDNKNVARELVLALCRYVDSLINAGKLAQTYPLIVQAYDCMIKWILVSQWIIGDQDCYKAVIATLSKGITIFDKDQTHNATPSEPVNVEKKKRRDTGFPPTKQLFQLPPRANKGSNHHTNATSQEGQTSSARKHSTVRKKEEVAVKMAAEYCMSQFVNQLGRFVLPYEHALGGYRPVMMDDIMQLKRIKAQEKKLSENSKIRYFLIDKRVLLSVIDVTNQISYYTDEPTNVPSVILVVRDTTGKYAWFMETKYKDTISIQVSPASNDDDITMNKSAPPSRQASHHQVTVPTAVAVNEKEIPSMDKIFLPDSDDCKQWEAIKVLMDKQDKSEANVALDNHESLNQYQIEPAGSNIDNSNARGFRLLLSQLGLLLPKNIKYVTPLNLSDSLISEVETLDMLNERDCISVSAYYAKSGLANWTELTETPPPLSQEFLQFIHCLGWPVKTAGHRGYKGKLDAAVCETIPYYSDRSVEFVVNVPYFLKDSSVSKVHEQVTLDDHVCVIWIEDLSHYKTLASTIKTSSASHSKAMVYIFINPLKNSANGLYWIRILIPTLGNTPASILASQRLHENALIFGPLVDGIVVSRHALGSMIRSTAISAHQACRVVTDTYTRPYVIRKEYIEEMAHRHRVKIPLSEFYFDIFAEKDSN